MRGMLEVAYMTSFTTEDNPQLTFRSYFAHCHGSRHQSLPKRIRLQSAGREPHHLGGQREARELPEPDRL